MIDFRGMRPCGMCVALVPLSTGCGHWRPGRKAEQDRKSEASKAWSPAKAEGQKRRRVRAWTENDAARQRARNARMREKLEALRAERQP